jgi:hypothetical protein
MVPNRSAIVSRVVRTPLRTSPAKGLGGDPGVGERSGVAGVGA